MFSIEGSRHAMILHAADYEAIHGISQLLAVCTRNPDERRTFVIKLYYQKKNSLDLPRREVATQFYVSL